MSKKSKSISNTQNLTEEIVKALIKDIKINSSSLRAIEKDNRYLSDDALVYHVRPVNSALTLSEGYIGITTGNLQDNNCSRWDQHKKSLLKVINGDLVSHHYEQKRSWTILNSIDDYEFRVIFQGTLEESLKIEKALRHSKNIGWNKSIGGSWKQQQHGFNWLEQDVKIETIKSNGQARLKLSAYDQSTGKRTLVSLFGSQKQSYADQVDYLSRAQAMIRNKVVNELQITDLSDLSPEILNNVIDAVRIELGGKPKRVNSDTVKGDYWLIDKDTKQVLNRGMPMRTKREITRILGGINQGHIHGRRNNLLNGSGNWTLKYAKGYAQILAFRDAQSGTTTVNKQYQKVWDALH